MKKELTVFFVGCTLLLAACAGLAVSDPVPMSVQPEETSIEATYEEPEYGIVPFTSGNQIRPENEEEGVLALYNYQIVLLELRNADKVSPADAEAAERNIEVFNGKMRSVLEELVEQGTTIGKDAREVYREYGALPTEYEDDAAMRADFCGSIVSLCLDRSSYTGGAHPNTYTVSYLFDLEAGQFIDITQLAEDPEAFRAGAAELLVEKAEQHAERACFWEDCDSVIARWNEAGLAFDGQGLTVIFSPYELAPYASGEITFHLSWEELEPLLGPGGMERLGQTEGE